MSVAIHLTACVYVRRFVDKSGFGIAVQFMPVSEQEINKVPGLFDKLNLK